jgi:L-glyceraldehyde 3-phosphate reductase
MRVLGTPLLIHQPRYNMLDRVPETSGVLATAADEGLGVIAFSPLAQGLLSDKYLAGLPAGSRATLGKSLDPETIDSRLRSRLAALAEIAGQREQSIAQMAIAWVLRSGKVTSALIGASRPEHIEACCATLARQEFSPEEIAAIDRALAAK